jgi:hypothetical protein
MSYYPRIGSRKMHQTTVRFGPDLWEALENECRHLGVSVAQYIREASLTRLVYAAGRRGDHEFEHSLGLVKAAGGRAGGRVDLELVQGAIPIARDVNDRAVREGSGSAAAAGRGRRERQSPGDLPERGTRPTAG